MRWRQIYNKFPVGDRKINRIILGAIIVGASINSLILPNHIADGGITGVAIILHYLTMSGRPDNFALNLPLFIIG